MRRLKTVIFDVTIVKMVKDLMPQLKAAWTQERTNLVTGDKPDSNEKSTAIKMKHLKDTNRDMNSSTEEFFATFENVIDDIDKIENNNKEIGKLQVIVWGGANQRQVQQNKEKLDDRVAQNKTLGVRIRNSLKKEQTRIDEKAKRSEKDEGKKISAREDHEIRLRRTQIAAQSRRFYDLWTEYNNLQIKYRDRSKESFKKRCRNVDANITDEELETMLDAGKTQMFNVSILQNTTKAREQLNELKDRHDEFLSLERSIKEIRDLFVELADLVSQQGELINNIAHNVEQAGDKVTTGTKQLEDAGGYQSRARKKKVICFALLFCFIVIIVIVVVGVPETPTTPVVEVVEKHTEFTEPIIEPPIKTNYS